MIGKSLLRPDLLDKIQRQTFACQVLDILFQKMRKYARQLDDVAQTKVNANV